MQGILNILKPPGMTSHDVVAYCRRILQQKRIGHTGTLDPPASGVLVLLLGQGTRLNQYLTGLDKVYRGEVTFGITTTTEDSTGTPVERSPAYHLTKEQVLEAMGKFTGPILQRPPQVSAVKYQGKPLHQWAREGKEVTVPERPVEIYSLKLLEFYRGSEPIGSPPRALFECHCSKGTYIRTLAVQIGQALGTGAHLSFLLRTRVGPFSLDSAVLLEEVAQAQDPRQMLLPLSAGLRQYPSVVLREHQVHRVLQGNSIFPEEHQTTFGDLSPGQMIRLENPPHRLLALATWEVGPQGSYFRPRKVFQE